MSNGWRVSVVLMMSIALSACSGKTSDTTSGGDTTPTENTATSSDSIEVTLVDYSFEGLPERVTVGTRFTVVNESEAELHEMVAFRLPDGEDRSVEELITLAPDELEAALGMPTFVLLAEPAGGQVIPAVGDGTVTEAGRYAAFCFIPTGADPQEYLAAAAESEGPPQVEGGPPHFVAGMFGEFTVEE